MSNLQQLDEALNFLNEKYIEDNSVLTKTQKTKIKEVCTKYSEELQKKYGKDSKKLFDGGVFNKLAFYFYKESIDIDFSGISQDEFFNYDYNFWKKIADDMGREVNKITPVLKTNVGDDSPFIYIFHKK